MDECLKQSNFMQWIVLSWGTHVLVKKSVIKQTCKIAHLHVSDKVCLNLMFLHGGAVACECRRIPSCHLILPKIMSANLREKLVSVTSAVIYQSHFTL